MTKNYYQNSLKFKILARIKQKIASNIVLREDIEDMGSPRQISRCFKDLIKIGELVKIGYGIYAKAYISENLNKPVIQGGFGQACKEALTKKGVKWEPGSAEQAYNAGLSTQIPVRTIIQLKSRYSGYFTKLEHRFQSETEHCFHFYLNTDFTVAEQFSQVRSYYLLRNASCKV